MKNKVVNYEIGKAPEHTLTFFGNKYETANVEVIEDIIIGYLGENKDTIILYESLKGADYFEALRKRHPGIWMTFLLWIMILRWIFQQGKVWQI